MLKLFQTYLGAFTSSWFMCSFDMVPFIILKGISLVSSTKRCSRFTCISSALTVKWKWSRSVVSDSATSWTVPARLIHPWDFPAKSTGVGCHFLLQGISLTQGSNLGLLHCRHLSVWAAREALGDLPNPGIEPRSLALQVDSLPAEPPNCEISHFSKPLRGSFLRPPLY